MSLDRHAAERRRFARLLGTNDDHGCGLPIGGDDTEDGDDRDDADADAADGGRDDEENADRDDADDASGDVVSPVRDR